MPNDIAPGNYSPSDQQLRALALANAGLAVAALAAHLAEAEPLDPEETAELMLNAGLQVLLSRHLPADARIIHEIGRWIDAEDEPPARGAAVAPAAGPAPWSWHPTPEGDLVLRDDAGAEAARIRTYRVPVLEAADPEADPPYDGVWRAEVRRPDGAHPPWSLTGLTLADAYDRIDAAIARQTIRWHHPTAEVTA